MRRRLFLPAAFGLAIGGAYALPWTALERAWTPDAFAATAIMIASGILAGIATLWLIHRLDTADRFTRFAAALLILPGATAAFASFALFAERLIYAERPPFDIWLQQVWWILSIAASAVFLFLTIAGRIMLPFGILLTIVFAVLVAARPNKSLAPRQR
ncbi:MAG TPA: hypothetical protein VLA28_03685 [Afifellaceae bacterium]|nr:hypothetical protein [Afifellaceae bacterium]